MGLKKINNIILTNLITRIILNINLKAHIKTHNIQITFIYFRPPSFKADLILVYIAKINIY